MTAQKPQQCGPVRLQRGGRDGGTTAAAPGDDGERLTALDPRHGRDDR